MVNVPAVMALEGQAEQTVNAELSAYVPAEQSAQEALPVVFLNFPAPQALHAPPSGPVNPALHLQPVPAMLPAGAEASVPQLMQVVAPAALKESARHWMQTSVPREALYFPA